MTVRPYESVVAIRGTLVIASLKSPRSPVSTGCSRVGELLLAGTTKEGSTNEETHRISLRVFDDGSGRCIAGGRGGEQFESDRAREREPRRRCSAQQRQPRCCCERRRDGLRCHGSRRCTRAAGRRRERRL